MTSRATWSASELITRALQSMHACRLADVPPSKRGMEKKVAAAILTFEDRHRSKQTHLNSKQLGMETICETDRLTDDCVTLLDASPFHTRWQQLIS